MVLEDLSRNQRDKMAAAEALAGSGATVHAYGDGVGQARFPKAAMWIVGIFVAIFVAVMIAFDRILIPGFLVLIVLAGLIHPRRGIAVTPSGVLVMQVSMWNARPNQILFTAPVGALVPLDPKDATARKVRLVIGPERIRLERRVYDLLMMAAERMGPLSVSSTTQYVVRNPGPGWFPDPFGRAEFRYWDGAGWTSHVS